MCEKREACIQPFQEVHKIFFLKTPNEGIYTHVRDSIVTAHHTEEIYTLKLIGATFLKYNV